MSSRGFRNHNPGNLRRGLDWKGLEAAQLDKHFCQFTSPEYGIRALAMLLLHYYHRDGLRTLRQLVAKYAPATENNCRAYEQALSRALGVSAETEIDWTYPNTMKLLIQAIIHHENGSQPYRDIVLEDGMRMAGVDAPAKELT